MFGSQELKKTRAKKNIVLLAEIRSYIHVQTSLALAVGTPHPPN
jgi:hypothetical protein